MVKGQLCGMQCKAGKGLNKGTIVLILNIFNFFIGTVNPVLDDGPTIFAQVNTYLMSAAGFQFKLQIADSAGQALYYFEMSNGDFSKTIR